MQPGNGDMVISFLHRPLHARKVCLFSLNFSGIIFIQRWLFRSLIHAYGQLFVFIMFRSSLDLWTVDMENLRVG